MKIAVLVALVAPVLAVPRGKHLVELSLPGEQNYNPNQSLYPQRALRVIGSFQSGFTEETFRVEAKRQCQAEPACSTVIGYLQEHSEVVDGSKYPVWFAWLIGGARATAADFHHANGTSHSFIYTINE
ncbi:hypothetical protein ISF_02064 [Cordyceps fumosorosea ARSEF 2679]|uniref:Uncharacterized protein n=1 Tax=Cordyceps fumosorosea (strain ARSEF 2679) TaxID=1081104 RepID=A0A168CL68_CORFA|nr:hypothetical protein ISF_02064 [Cordyceps fumosorosea ARSEF 2679]OAA71513.1 hypothetical protein ISF_02064 [Cordyceps fumosorosea ARSEF 2679]